MLKKENKISKDYLIVLLESMDSKLKGLVEGHSYLNEKIDNLDKNLNEKIDNLDKETKSNFQTVFNLLSNIDDDIKDIKSEIVDIKSELVGIKKTLVNKADLNKVADLEKRIKIVEMELLELRAA